MSARDNKFVRVSDVEASIHDSDPEIDLGFMNPHFTPDWEEEISDDELERILAASELKLRDVRQHSTKDGLRIRG